MSAGESSVAPQWNGVWPTRLLIPAFLVRAPLAGTARLGVPAMSDCFEAKFPPSAGTERMKQESPHGRIRLVMAGLRRLRWRVAGLRPWRALKHLESDVGPRGAGPMRRLCHAGHGLRCRYFLLPGVRHRAGVPDRLPDRVQPQHRQHLRYGADLRAFRGSTTIYTECCSGASSGRW